MATTSSKRILVWTALAVAGPLLTACGGKYYQVTDADSGKSYYTRDIEHEKGHIHFTDKTSGDEVSLGSSEIREISSQEYKNAVRK